MTLQYRIFTTKTVKGPHPETFVAGSSSEPGVKNKKANAVRPAIKSRGPIQRFRLDDCVLSLKIVARMLPSARPSHLARKTCDKPNVLATIEFIISQNATMVKYRLPTIRARM